jgi:hypothetical protein
MDHILELLMIFGLLMTPRQFSWAMFTKRSTIPEFRAISMGEFWGEIVFVNWNGHVNVRRTDDTLHAT